MRKSLTMLALLATAGCNFAPAYKQPVMPVSAQFVDGTPQPSPDNRLATDLGWRDFFGDERLRALIEAALTNNRDLAQSLARVAQARAQFRVADAARLPQVDLNGQYSRSRQPIGSLPIPGGGGGGTGPSAIELENWSADVGVSSFELDLWGRVRNLSAQARAQYLASVQGVRAFRLSLISQVAATYYQILSGEERIAYAERSLAARERGLVVAKKRLDAGITSTIDYDQTALLVTQARSDLAALRLKVGQDRNLLEVLVGGPIDTALPPGRPLESSGQFARIDAGLPSDLLRSRPDVLEAEFNLRTANANIGAARAAFFPTISLTGMFGFISPSLGDLFKSGNKTWSYAGNATLPLFDGGKRQAELKLSRAQADELAAKYQSVVQTAFREVADALVARRRYVEQVDALKDAVTAQERLALTARRRYDQGLSIYLEVLDAERGLFDAQQQLTDLKSTSLQNDVSLYVALGGGTKERFDDPAKPDTTP